MRSTRLADAGDALVGSPQRLTKALIAEFGREPGRSVMLRIRSASELFTFELAPDAPRPAASLLKVPLALAVEDALRQGSLDPDAVVSVGRLRECDDGPGALRVLDSDLVLRPADLLGLMLSLSDNACARWLFEAVGAQAVRRATAAAGALATSVDDLRLRADAPLAGSTTARDAVSLLDVARDATVYPLTARALHNTLHNSRIPLGATDGDLAIAHKTGTLLGVANDVAVLRCDRGTMTVAFLSDEQHDTLVTGYEMGICVRGVLQAWGWRVQRTEAIP